MTTEHFNGLSEAEQERLVIVAEECAEVIHVTTKILRHGYESCHPKKPSETNRVALIREIADPSIKPSSKPSRSFETV